MVLSRCMNIVDMLTAVYFFFGSINNRIFDTKRRGEAYSWWYSPFVVYEGVLSCDSGHAADRAKGEAKTFLENSSLFTPC